MITLGIYGHLVMHGLAFDVNLIAGRYDQKRSMNYALLWFLVAPVTLGIAGIVWLYNICMRIIAEFKRRDMEYKIDGKIFWIKYKIDISKLHLWLIAPIIIFAAVAIIWYIIVIGVMVMPAVSFVGIIVMPVVYLLAILCYLNLFDILFMAVNKLREDYNCHEGLSVSAAEANLNAKKRASERKLIIILVVVLLVLIVVSYLVAAVWIFNAFNTMFMMPDSILDNTDYDYEPKETTPTYNEPAYEEPDTRYNDIGYYRPIPDSSYAMDWWIYMEWDAAWKFLLGAYNNGYFGDFWPTQPDELILSEPRMEMSLPIRVLNVYTGESTIRNIEMPGWYSEGMPYSDYVGPIYLHADMHTVKVVTAGAPLNVRARPWLDAEVIGQYDNGATFYVTGIIAIGDNDAKDRFGYGDDPRSVLLNDAWVMIAELDSDTYEYIIGFVNIAYTTFVSS
jgi:hypothetical protein